MMNLRIQHSLLMLPVLAVLWLTSAYIEPSVTTRPNSTTMSPVPALVPLLSPITTKNAGTVQEISSVHLSDTAGIAWSPDGKLLAVANGNGIALYSIMSASISRYLGAGQKSINVVFNYSDDSLASSVVDNGVHYVQLWNTTTGSLLNSFRGNSLITCLSFSSDGQILAAGEGDDLNGIAGTVQFWNMKTGLPQRTLRVGNQMVTAIAFSPDGSFLASSSKDRIIQLWSLKTNREVVTLRGYTDLVGNVTFSPDGKLLAFRDIDENMHGNIRLWDIDKSTELPKLVTEEGEITSLAFNPDGTLLASAAYDGKIRLWNPSTGQQITALDRHPHGVTTVAFSPEGTALASAGADDIVRIWGVSQ